LIETIVNSKFTRRAQFFGRFFGTRSKFISFVRDCC